MLFRKDPAFIILCRTYFIDNLVIKGFESDIVLIYCTDNVQFWSQDKDLFIYNKIFVPIHIVNSCFILAVIFIQKQNVFRFMTGYNLMMQQNTKIFSSVISKRNTSTNMERLCLIIGM